MSTSSGSDSHENESPKRRITGAGVLIMTSNYNRPFYLLGREKYKSFFFKNKFFSGLMINKFRSLFDKPPIHSSKTAKDC